MTMEQVLEKIKQDRGENALRDSRQLMGMFADYSKNQLRPQANALQVFLSCRGNERILDLRNATQYTQQIELHRLMQEMAGDYNLQEATVLEVCSTFWRVANDTDPPQTTQLNPPAPEPKPEPIPPDPAPPLPETKKPQHTRLEIAAFSFGWILLCLLVIAFVYALAGNPNPVTNPILFVPVIFAVLLLAMQYTLWKKSILRLLDDVPSGLFLFLGLMLVVVTPGMALEQGGGITLGEIGCAAGGGYIFLWNLIPFMEKRKRKKGGDQ